MGTVKNLGVGVSVPGSIVVEVPTSETSEKIWQTFVEFNQAVEVIQTAWEEKQASRQKTKPADEPTSQN